MLSQIFRYYSYFLYTIPFIVYVFHIIFRDIRHPIIEALVKTFLIAIGLGITGSIIGCISGISLKTLFSFTWGYSGPIIWGIFFIIYYYILIQKQESNLTSFTLATLATVGGGWLYEVPFFHPLSMFLCSDSFFYLNVQILCIILLLSELRKKIYDPNPIIYIILLSCMFLSWKAFPFPNGQIICLIILGGEIMKMGFKPNRMILIMLIIFMVFSISLFLNKDSLWRFCRETLIFLNVKLTPLYAQNVKWIYRIPASLFLLSLLSGIKNRGEYEK